MSEWQPIETAPADDTPILAFAPASKSAFNVNAQSPQIRVDKRVKRYGWKYAHELPEARYSHWQPLPEPPA